MLRIVHSARLLTCAQVSARNTDFPLSLRLSPTKESTSQRRTQRRLNWPLLHLKLHSLLYGDHAVSSHLYLVSHRARLFLERCEAGACAMLAISASPASVPELYNMKPHSSYTIACMNSSAGTVVSGSVDDIADLRTALTTPSTVLAAPYGFHSFQMDPILDDYVSLAGGITYSAPKIPVASTLLASIVESPGIFNGHYLGQQTH